MKTAPLIVSIPAGELSCCELPGAVFPAERLIGGAISEPLRHALAILQRALGNKYRSILCVARPEMFVEATTLRWLKDRIAGASDHICLTDGHALKAIPGMHNRLFFYASEWVASVNHLRTCLRRGSEQLLQFHGTINDQGSVFAEFPEHPLEREILLATVDADNRRLGWSFPFYRNPHCHQDSADRMLARGEYSAPPEIRVSDASFELVICSEQSLEDLNFCRILVEKINQVAFESTRRLVIQLPVLEPTRNGNTQRMMALLSGVARSGVSIPRAYLKGVHLVSDLNVVDLKNATLQNATGGYHLTIPQSIATWRQSRELFSGAKSITCHLDETKQKAGSPITSNLRKMIGSPIKFMGWTAECRRSIERAA